MISEKELEAGEALRCFCARHPLLARYGTDRKGEPWIHVKTWRREQLMAEVLCNIGAGSVHIRCRNCLRWFTVKIVRGTPVLTEESIHAEIS